MKMNFIGLHTYPLYEPTVWVGKPSDYNSTSVLSSYPTSYQNTLRGDWAYYPKNTSAYSNGNSLLFTSDCYGSSVMDGQCPRPSTPHGDNLVFDRAGEMLRNAFSYARSTFEVKTCVGTELPLYKPDKSVSTAEYYQGIFGRIMNTYEIDYYWFWTPEFWEWNKVNMSDPVVQDSVTDLLTAYKTWKSMNLSFDLATCGWVLGALGNRSYSSLRIYTFLH